MYILDGQNTLNVVRVYTLFMLLQPKLTYRITDLICMIQPWNGVRISKMTNAVTSVEATIFIKTNQNVNELIQQSYLDAQNLT